jgi:hypothetical protein
MQLATATTCIDPTLTGGAYLHGNADENKNKERDDSVLGHGDEAIMSPRSAMLVIRFVSNAW